jgi:hypothetical protein
MRVLSLLPQVWNRLKVEKLGAGGFSYLITWQGSNRDLHPALFISHVDVVPVSPGTEQDWRYPPFSGAVAEGYIWGEQQRLTGCHAAVEIFELRLRDMLNRSKNPEAASVPALFCG